MRLAYLDLRHLRPKEDSWLIGNQSWNDEETIENLSAYFLSRIIVRSHNWIQVTYPDLFKNRTATWILKVGAPVEYWQGSAIRRFERVLKFAWALSFTPSAQVADMLTLPQLNQCMSQVRKWVTANPDLDCFAKPEIAAAVWSHICAAGSRQGFFTFFDVGEGTTEGASFRFYREGGESKISFYSGFVRSLGAVALTHQMSTEIGISEKVLMQSFLSPSSSEDDLHLKILKSQTRHSFQKLVAEIVCQGCSLHRKVNPYIWEEEIGPKLGIFMGGGGGQIPFYPDTVKATYTDFQHDKANIKPYDLRVVPVPQDLRMRGLEANVFNRFAIAYGLSIADGEFPEFDFPSKDDAPSPSSSASEPPAYSDTKELC